MGAQRLSHTRCTIGGCFSSRCKALCSVLLSAWQHRALKDQTESARSLLMEAIRTAELFKMLKCATKLTET